MRDKSDQNNREEPKYGKWIRLLEKEKKYKCSLCGRVSVERSKYCPDCGKRIKR